MTGLLLDQPRAEAPTFAEPGEALGAADTMKALFSAPIDPITNPQPYADLIRASERATRLTGNISSESAAREEAYDRRIAAIKAATGVQLENPERDGYQQIAKGMIRDQIRAGLRAGVDPNIQGGIVALQKQLFDQEFAKVQAAYPDLQFGPIDDDAKKIALESIQGLKEARNAPDLNPFVAPIDVFAGGLIGSRRDPIFLGSLVAGPASSTSKFALGRIASGALRAGFYNAGISALEQPAVQDWRAKLGLEHGVVPALEDVGQAFLFGAIPGAVIHGGIEGVRAVRMRRLMAGAPEPGDTAAALSDLLGVSDHERAMIIAGEHSAQADRATMTIPRPRDTPINLHDDMAAAALKRADQPEAPSPEAIRAVSEEPATDPIITPTLAKLRSLGTPMDIAQRWATDPEGTLQQIEEAIRITRDAEKGLLKRHGKKRVDELEDAPLTKEESDFLYYGTDHTDSEFWRHLRSQLQPVENLQEAAQEIAYEFKRLPRDTSRLSNEDQLVMARLQVLFSEVSRLGGDLPQVLREAAGRYGARFDDPQDAIFMVQNAAEHLSEMMRPPTETPRALPPPDPIIQEARDRAVRAAPQTEADAARVADEAFDDIGRAHGMAGLRENMARGDQERAVPPPAPVEPGAEAAPAPRPRGDVLDKVPFIDNSGAPKMLTAKGAAAVGERENTLSMLVKSCK